MEKNINPEEIQELREYLEGGPKSNKKRVNIIFDGKQTAIRIPSEFVEVMKIDPKKDIFEFEVEIPSSAQEQPKMSGRLIKNAQEKTPL